MSVSNNEAFIDKANIIHKNFYDYSLVDYITSKKKVKIVCREHGVFEQIPNSHLNGRGCPKCSVESIKKHKTKNSEYFITKSKEIHKDLYDYSLVDYVTSKKKVKIICKEHGIFKQTPNNHLNGHGCFLCSQHIKIDNNKYNNDEFIKLASEHHNKKYDYALTNYENCRSKIKIVCPIHGEFEQIPYVHLQNHGCAKCSGILSKDENDLLAFIEQNFNGIILKNNRTVISPLELDIYLPELKLAFEFNGLYWHCEINKDNNYHQNKTNLCESNGIHLVHIYEDDWIYKQDIIKSRILNLLGKSNKIYARKCDVREISFKESKNFLVENHIQGYSISKINTGLYYNNELVSLMTFGKLRKNLGQVSKDGSYELLRFCNKLNNTVIGGANKLLKYFENTHQPKDIISYADRSWTMNNGNTLYDKLGFNFMHISQPCYFYIMNKKRQNRFKYRKDILVKMGYDKNKSEHEIMLQQNIFKIYNSGNLKFSKILEKNYANN